MGKGPKCFVRLQNFSPINGLATPAKNRGFSIGFWGVFYMVFMPFFDPPKYHTYAIGKVVGTSQFFRCLLCKNGAESLDTRPIHPRSKRLILGRVFFLPSAVVKAGAIIGQILPPAVSVCAPATALDKFFVVPYTPKCYVLSIDSTTLFGSLHYSIFATNTNLNAAVL